MHEFEIAANVIELVVLPFVLWILSDIRDRVKRLEDNAMNSQRWRR